MNGKDLLEAMTYVDEKYVDEAEKQSLKRSVPLGWLSAAACLCILIGGAVFLLQPGVSKDCAAMPENGSVMEDSVMEAERATEPATATMPSGIEEPSVSLRIDAWNDDGFIATVCDGETDADQLPLGQEVTVRFDEQIRVNGEQGVPTEADFPVGSHVIVIFHSYTEENGAVSLVMTAILTADTTDE